MSYNTYKMSQASKN